MTCGAQATITVDIAMAIAHVDVAIVKEHSLFSTLLLPPGGVTVEEAQTLLSLAVAGHLVLELAALLGEGADAIVDPLVAVNLLAPAASNDKSSVLTVQVGASGRVVLRIGGQDKSILAAGSGSDNVVDARLQYGSIKLLIIVFGSPP